jgi:hypothetical protein
MAYNRYASMSNIDYTESELYALQLAFTDHAAQQAQVSDEVWGKLAARGLVHQVRAIDDLDEQGRSIYEEPERSWFELTEDGCRTINALVGTSFGLSSCWVCEEESPSEESDCLHTCSRCGAYAGDE